MIKIITVPEVDGSMTNNYVNMSSYSSSTVLQYLSHIDGIDVIIISLFHYIT
jgi:hypothetical protein